MCDIKVFYYISEYNRTNLTQSIFVQNKLGDTPLHNAAWKGHADVVQALLEKGAP